MFGNYCAACGDRVRIAGGLENLWTFEGGSSKGITLELEDGSEYFLCFECIEKLPEEPSAADIEALIERQGDDAE